MKIITSVLIFVSTCLASLAQTKSSNSPFLTKSLKGESFGKINVETSHGDISVAIDPAGEASVELYVHANGHEVFLSKEAIQKLLNDNYTMDISVSGDALNAIVRPKSISLNLKPGLNISFVVYATKGASTKLRTSHGNIDLSDMKGIEDLATSHGNIKLENISGKINAQTSHGDILLNHASDDIDLRTSHGNIEVKNTKGKIRASTDHGNVTGNSIEGNLSATTSHGDVSFYNLSGRMEASTSHGNIKASFDEINGNITMDNSKGDITLQLPKGKGVNLDLKGSSVDTSGLENFAGSKQSNSIHGTLNNGGELVNAKTSKGNVRLTMK